MGTHNKRLRMDGQVDKRCRETETVEVSSDTMMDIFRLTCYIVNHSVYRQTMIEQGTLDDFIHTVFLAYIERGYPSFNPEKGKLSTHISTFIYKQWAVLSNQAANNLSFEEARYMERLKYTKSAESEQYKRTLALLCPLSTDIIPSNSDGEDDDTVSLIDYGCMDQCLKFNPEKQYMDRVTRELFNKQIDRYLSEYKPDWFKKDKAMMDRERDVVCSYIFGVDDDSTKDKVTYGDLAEKYGVSRQWIAVIIKSFICWARNDRTFLQTFYDDRVKIDPTAYSDYRNSQRGRPPKKNFKEEQRILATSTAV